MEYLDWCQKRRDPSYYGPKRCVRYAAISVHTYTCAHCTDAAVTAIQMLNFLNLYLHVNSLKLKNYHI